MEKTLIKTKTYTTTVEEFSDGSSNLLRVNDGFGGIELIGLCSLIKKEVFLQMDGEFKPDVIKRQSVELKK